MLWRRFRRHKSAFTLAELLVAMVVMSILAISVFLITSAASSTFTRGTDSITADDVKDIVMEYVKLSVRSASKVWLSNDYNASDRAALRSSRRATCFSWARGRARARR